MCVKWSFFRLICFYDLFDDIKKGGSNVMIESPTLSRTGVCAGTRQHCSFTTAQTHQCKTTAPVLMIFWQWRRGVHFYSCQCVKWTIKPVAMFQRWTVCLVWYKNLHLGTYRKTDKIPSHPESRGRSSCGSKVNRTYTNNRLYSEKNRWHFHWLQLSGC